MPLFKATTLLTYIFRSPRVAHVCWSGVLIRCCESLKLAWSKPSNWRWHLWGVCLQIELLRSPSDTWTKTVLRTASTLSVQRISLLLWSSRVHPCLMDIIPTILFLQTTIRTPFGITMDQLQLNMDYRVIQETVFQCRCWTTIPYLITLICQQHLCSHIQEATILFMKVRHKWF